MEACLWNIKNAQVDFIPCFEHDKPIPDAQNAITEKALAAKADWLWFLEEDVIPPENALRLMLPEAKVISAKYRNRGGTWAYSLDPNGRLEFAGMGCLLVHSSVFAKLEPPVFDTTREWQWNHDGTVENRRLQHGAYGRQDIHFFGRLWQEGIEARLANVVCGHARVVKHGEPHTNKGCHEIEII